MEQKEHNLLLDKPNKDGNVWPNQVCPAFELRADTMDNIRQCWYCRCADFHLDKARTLEIGICYWPKKVSK